MMWIQIKLNLLSTWRAIMNDVLGFKRICKITWTWLSALRLTCLLGVPISIILILSSLSAVLLRVIALASVGSLAILTEVEGASRSLLVRTTKRVKDWVKSLRKE